MKKSKVTIIFISAIITLIALILLLNREKVENKVNGDKNLSRLYKMIEEKKNKNIFASRLKNKKVKTILRNLSIDKMQIATSILANKKLVEFINNPNILFYLENNDYDKAMENAQIAREMRDLSVLSPELYKYFNEVLTQNEFDRTMDMIEKRPQIIKIKETIRKLLPIENAKEIFDRLSNTTLIKIGEVLYSSPITVEFIEKKNIEKYSLEEKVEIGHTLYEIEKLDSELSLKIGEMFEEFDIRRVALYGDLYVRDIKNEQMIKKEYESENFTFENPFIKYNPYGRTPLAYGIKYKPADEEELLKITILGLDGMPNFSYEKKYTGNGLLPIVGLYPKIENVVIIEKLNQKNKKIIKSNKIVLKTEALDDQLPAIYIEKRIVNNIQPGFNLASFNLNNEGMPFAFDSMGNMRYILKTGKEMGKITIEKINSDLWEIKNDKDEFQMDILGKILGRVEKKDEDGIIKNKKIKYLARNNNILTVISYIDGTYPISVISEYGLDSKNDVFKSILFYKKNGSDENKIEDAERITLYEGDGDK